VVRAAERDGIPRDWIDAAQRSPIHALINVFKVALPLHPEYRTMPMVWYIPPLSPVIDVVRDTGEDAEDTGNLFAAIDALRIPVEYLAELFTAGDTVPVDGVLKKLAAMRSYMRDINMGRDPNASIPAAVGMSEEEMYDMYRLLAIAKYEERYVIPPAHAEQAHSLEEIATECSVSEYGGGNPEIFGEGSGSQTPLAVENFRMLQETSGCSRTGRPPTPSPHRTTRPRGSTCSTGTARAHRPGCSRPRTPCRATGRVTGRGASSEGRGHAVSSAGGPQCRAAHDRLAGRLPAARLPLRGAARPRRLGALGVAGVARPAR